MEMKSKPSRVVNREYIFTQKELKKLLDVKGEIQSIGLQQGRSPLDEANGVSSDTDTYYINTKEESQL